MNTAAINKKLQKAFGGRFSAVEENGAVFVRGKSDDWNEIIAACQTAAEKYGATHVVNDIVYTGAQPLPMRLPSLRDDALNGRAPDVLIIGGGISGASIARELMKWKLDVLLVDKEADLALQASGRNDGEVHPGIDLGKGSLKHKYIRRANRMYADVCQTLDVPFHRVGQYVLFRSALLRPVIGLYALWRRLHDGIEDTKLLSGKELLRREPRLSPDTKFALWNPSAGCVCPYGLTIAYAENAVQNGAAVSLNTAVLSMEVRGHRIVSVNTNRGTLYPKLVINAAGVFAEDVAAMADDRFYSIHPRRGTNSILDQKAGAYMHSIASVKDLHIHGKNHSKGGGILHTVHDNLLIGPDAVETPEKENTETRPESIKTVFDKQTQTMPALSQRDIITYFTGVRAPTFEEDFILEPGRNTKNLIHVAGIQSPGLTTAPAVAVDMAALAVELLKKERPVEVNPAFDPVRKGVPVLRELDDAAREDMICKNPDYGEIVCRCEEISKGEILDALRAPICVPTLDGIKKRVRPGMGRCQGGFCSPLVTKIIAEFLGVPLADVRKSSAESVITFGETKNCKGGDEA
ncbi:MAG: NAD(P)/FAD-dependent oxidoreductase [Clostridia bacterium]|nr:NAD(P)/FAD-dependent oxidoreductase [Clostridia bacterium]